MAAEIDNVMTEAIEAVESADQQLQIPEELPLLPLRDIVIYPFMIVPLFVSREKSIRAVDEALGEHRMILLGNPALPIPEHLKGRVGPLCNALTPLLDARQIEELRRQYKAFAGGGGRTNLLAWGQAADKTAARAGLLLCDDIATAAKLLEREEGPRGPLLADLIGFAASAQYGTLRRHLGVAID